MRIAARWIHGWVIPEQVAIPNIKEAFDDDGSLVNEDLEQRVKAMASSIVENTIKLRR
tara:strand:- start:337 stop:510 length:174 start_codon:yes stop_codon:yes gene_type:complete